MELKKGMWVITNDRMKIGQIKDFCTCEMCEKRGFYEPIITNQIYITDYDKSRGFHGYKFYENLIDLVEYLDLLEIESPVKLYGKNKEVSLFNPVRCDGFTEFEDGTHCIILDLDYLVDVKDLKIKSVLTKEQFNNNKYEVK